MHGVSESSVENSEDNDKSVEALLTHVTSFARRLGNAPATLAYLVESADSAFEQKALVLESLVEFYREPALIVGLYTNCDCHPSSTHLFEGLCLFWLAKAKESRYGIIATEGILTIIDCIHRKFLHNADRDRDDPTYDAEISRQLQKKRALNVSVKYFN